MEGKVKKDYKLLVFLSISTPASSPISAYVSSGFRWISFKYLQVMIAIWKWWHLEEVAYKAFFGVI